ncbi:MAG: protein kinase [Pirellulales bacterium]|nr:protein kinase [Pirellulales bacterium]
MREQPPPQLAALLQRLGLATAEQVGQMGRRVRRLARDLPRFESVWVDALAQARILTAFQAAEINAGRAASLRVGPYLVCRPLPWPGYAVAYQARRVDSAELVRLMVVPEASRRADGLLGRLEALAAVSGKLCCENLAPVAEVGDDGRQLWAASPWVEGQSAAEWMVRYGRFPPQTVLTIARAMVAALARLERVGLCHGDLSVSGLLLTDAGRVVLLHPGLRPALRPEEGYAHADLPPEAFDSMAPERITEGTPPTIASDVFSCGCVWWHLLCGRGPLAGGDSLAKLRAAQTAKIPELRRLAPEVPTALAEAVSACLHRQPRHRCQSLARLAAMLDPSGGRGNPAAIRCVPRPYRPPGRRGPAVRPSRPSHRTSWRWAAMAGCLVVAATMAWPMWRDGLPFADRWAASRGAPVPSPATASLVPEDAVAASRRPESSGQGPAAGNHGTGSQDRVSRNPASQDPVSQNSVLPAHYEVEQPTPPSPSPAHPQPPQATAQGPRDLVLAADAPLEVDSLPLRPGQRVRGEPGERPVVLVPRAGLPIAADDVCFENIDFVHAGSDASDVGPNSGAVICLSSARAAFRGCSFRSAPDPQSRASRAAVERPVAIRWTHPTDRSRAEMELPSGRVQLSDCLLRGVGAGLDCRTAGALSVEVANTLHLGPGPLVRLDHCPTSEEPVLIAASRVTLRDAGGLLECDCRRLEGPPGEISIQTTDCVLAPRRGTGLLCFPGPQSPEVVLRSLSWAGQGTLVTPEAIVAAWVRSDGSPQVLDDEAVSIAGVVRSAVEFAGEASSGPEASRVLRWQAPLRSNEPPGIDPAGAHWPAALPSLPSRQI